MYSHTVQDLLNNIFQSLSCNFSVLSFSCQWLYSFQKACKCLPVSSPTSLKGTVSERKAFLQYFKKDSECGSMQQVQKESQHDIVLKGYSHLVIIRRTRAYPNSLPLAQMENPQQREMITVFYERAVFPSSLQEGQDIILNYISFDFACALLNTRAGFHRRRRFFLHFCPTEGIAAAFIFSKADSLSLFVSLFVRHCFDLRAQ